MSLEAAMERLFKVEKPVVGVVHLPPLPGSPRYGGSMAEVLEKALRDARALVEGGVNGLVVENFNDTPFYPRRVPPVTVAAMTKVAAMIREEFPEVPLGINVLRNDALSAMSIAYVVGARFIRVNVLTEVAVAPEGLLVGEAHELLRLKRSLGANVAIMADVDVKHAKPLVGRSISSVARDAVERGGADAIIVTGEATGSPASLSKVLEVKRAVGKVPVFVGSGINAENASKFLEACDGLIVGTYFKEGGIIGRPVDVDRVKRLMAIVSKYRRELS